MRRFSNPYRLLALAGLLSVVSWGCTTDSPTAPRQEVPPIPPGGSQVYYITINADPGGIVISDTTPTGVESTTLEVEVRLNGPGGPRPIDGTTILVTTSLGSFSNLAIVQETGASLTNGRTFLTLFSGGLPVQLGIATVQVHREGSVGETQVPISILEADFISSNPENNLSVSFTDASSGNPTGFSWDFGDGTSSNKENPHHLYPGPGTYQVTLTVTKGVGGRQLSDSVTKPVTATEVVLPP